MPTLAPPSEHASAPPSELWKINEDLDSRTIYNGLEWQIYIVNNTCFDKIAKKLFYLIFFFGGGEGGWNLTQLSSACTCDLSLRKVLMMGPQAPSSRLQRLPSKFLQPFHGLIICTGQPQLVLNLLNDIGFDPIAISLDVSIKNNNKEFVKCTIINKEFVKCTIIFCLSQASGISSDIGVCIKAQYGYRDDFVSRYCCQ